jgi:hypothetical protein
MTCPACGCQGHGQTHHVRCASCQQEKWPTLRELPGPGWVCRLCQLAGAETVARRQEHGRAVAMKKAVRAAQRVPGAHP